MTYYQPDPVNATIIKWASRVIILLLAITLIAVVATLTLRALALLNSSLVALAQTIPTFLNSLDPLLQLIFLIFAAIAMLMICKKFACGILALVQEGSYERRVE